MADSSTALARLRRSLAYRAAHWQRASRISYFRALAVSLPGRVHFPAPLFLVGCPTAGKTTLAQLLGRNPQVLILSNQIQFWLRAYPLNYLNSLGGQVFPSWLGVTPAAAEPGRSRRLKNWLWAEMQVAGKQSLIDESPWHSFRLGFLHSVFPEAKFVHLVRRGLDAAQAIEARCRAGRLWGGRWHNWEAVVEFAEASPAYRGLPALCHTDFERGLLLWRMALETARAQARAYVPPEQYLEIRFEDMLGQPQTVCRELEAFTGWDLHAADWESALRPISAAPAVPSVLPPVAQVLAGELVGELQYS